MSSAGIARRVDRTAERRSSAHEEVARRRRADGKRVALDTETSIGTPPARFEAFGFQPTPARVRLAKRSASWRMTRALLSLFLGLGLAPVVALLPPHIPWAAGSIIAGCWFAWRFSRERVTLLSYDGTCPRCSGEVQAEPRAPLASSQGVHCGSCGQGLVLEIEGV